jgi:BirA family biotin operon repressor/biotin-[acetyl-CoA-carboxylase] ligase
MFIIHKLEKVDSTNTLARDYPIGTVLVAAEQDKGKGRFDRSWVSEKGGLWFSIVLEPSKRAFEYTFITSLAVLESVKFGEIKWPNDIVYEGKKLCGILTEVISEGNMAKRVIVGVGLNVNNKSPSDVGGVSLAEIDGEKDLDALLSRILTEFERIGNMEFEQVLKLYKSKCGILGKEITVKAVDREVKGKAIDIAKDGRLMLKTEEGLLELDEGDVSLV